MTLGSSKGRLAALEAAIAEITDRLALLEKAVSDRAPSSEIERLNHAFELIAERAPASEVERLNLAFDQIADRAPASEIKRLNHVFDLLARRPPPSETYLASTASERLVEVPWVLGKYRGEQRVAEVGYAFAEQHYLGLLLGLGIPFLVGIDAAMPAGPRHMVALHQVQASVLNDCVRASSFELVLCISTLEHIGRDNTAYGLDDGKTDSTATPDLDAIGAMARWVSPQGRLLLSVPYGRFEDHGWFINYDREHLDEVIAASQLNVVEESFYGWLPGGWLQVESGALSNRGYRSLGASHAGGVALVEFQREG